MQRFAVSKPFKKVKYHQKYHSDHKLVEEVFDGFKMVEQNQTTLKEIIDITKINKDTIYYWHRQWQKDHQYRPGARYGKHRKLFEDAQERAVADFLRIQYIIPGVLVRRKHLRRIIMNLWRSFNPNSRQRAKDVVSYHFIRDFCKRQKLAFRKLRKKKRSEISSEEVAEYAKIYAEVFTSIPWNRILNMDETPINYVTARNEVLAEQGTEEVNAQLPVDPKNNFTVLATISLSGDKLPPVLLATGKTTVCRQQFDGMETQHEYEVLHSPGGFTNENVMIEYLKLVNSWMSNEHTVLILDRYTAHTTKSVREEAHKNNIRLVYIPTSATDLYQPLDKRIFGAIKSKYSSKCDDYLFEFDEGPSKAKAADMFLECWAELNRDTIISAWDLCEESESEDEDSDEFSLPSSSEEEEEEDIDTDSNEDSSESLESDHTPKRQPITPPRRWLH